MRIAMIGTGYVGLVSGACFSEFGVDVVCVDKDVAKIEGLRAGKMPIYEPGLDQLVANNAKDNRLSFTAALRSVVKDKRLSSSSPWARRRVAVTAMPICPSSTPPPRRSLTHCPATPWW